MKRIVITVGAALLAAVPATMGFLGNESFTEKVPVRVPSRAIAVDDAGRSAPVKVDTTKGVRSAAATIKVGDDKGGIRKHIEPGDDKGGIRKHVEPGDDKGGIRKHIEPGDDKGGTAKHIEPGDDKGGTAKHIEPGDDKGGRSEGSGKGGGGDDDS